MKSYSIYSTAAVAHSDCIQMVYMAPSTAQAMILLHPLVDISCGFMNVASNLMSSLRIVPI
jgi:hypothetical protein